MGEERSRFGEGENDWADAQNMAQVPSASRLFPDLVIVLEGSVNWPEDTHFLYIFPQAYKPCTLLGPYGETYIS